MTVKSSQQRRRCIQIKEVYTMKKKLKLTIIKS